ncbi:DUF2817 domain-containing protein [Candidatus Woesearchaeota archaeon]|nr:DUF2817 domain-containing protein [Candidatus Woesearchaeota archaeon]
MGLDNKTDVFSLEQNYFHGKEYTTYGVVMGSGSKQVLLSAGIHGDEPAGIYTLLDFIEGPISDYSGSCRFLIFPCLNPYGFENNTRHNIFGVDLNRSFTDKRSALSLRLEVFVRGWEGYMAAINLHEDNTDFPTGNYATNPRGFYVYETSMNCVRLGQDIIKALQPEYKICTNPAIYDEKNVGGVIDTRSVDGEFEQFLENHAQIILTPETPTCWPLETRIEAHMTGLKTALDKLI